MRYIYDEKSGDEKPRLVFALGHQEAIILYSLLAKARRYMPKTMETQFDYARIGDMCKTLEPLMKQLTKLDYTGNPPRPLEVGELGASQVSRFERKQTEKPNAN